MIWQQLIFGRIAIVNGWTALAHEGRIYHRNLIVWIAGIEVAITVGFVTHDALRHDLRGLEQFSHIHTPLIVVLKRRYRIFGIRTSPITRGLKVISK